MYETDDPDLRQPTPAVDPQVNATLSDIKDDQEMRLEFINKITEKLKTCYDPEIDTDIYTLGLIYDVKVTSERYVFVLMSLTSAFCPAVDEIVNGVRQAVESIPGLKCKVRITMTPMWSRDMIDPEIRELMGL
jgi:metal-sulfur cluster biosynthetic enzyme|tara:strand:+ start:1580 stop:1978 length:399 start_codon:yes stop_codon:yes gene_type:complete